MNESKRMHAQDQNQNQEGWPLDYDWARRGGPWDEFTDVMLVGDPQGDAGVIQALRDWVARQSQERAEVDGEARAIFYAGGVQGYLDGGEGEASWVICLHSKGEDAFDSLSHYSREIARFVRGRHAHAALVWREARHDRGDHQLDWP